VDGFQTIIYEKEGGLAWVTLNRPDVLNAINLQMRDELWEVVHAALYDPEVGAVIFRGAGERAFCAGADISEFGTAPSYVEARRARQQRDLWGVLEEYPKPLLAAIHGYALGAGIELPLFCDIRIASEDARLGLPEVNLGYIPSAGGTQTMPRTVPRGVALHMILTGDPIDAWEALRWGLVHRVVPRAQLYAEAEALARRLLERPPQALGLAKRALRRGLDLPLEEALRQDGRLARRLQMDARVRRSLAGEG
jgi:enoyl-CoA hydratase/carnithine racemase